MRCLLWLGVGLMALCLAASGGYGRAKKPGAMPSIDSGAGTSSDGAIAVVGRTQRVSDRRSSVASASLHSAPEVALVAGTPVTKSEIVDLRELDVRCDLTPQRADELALGQEANLWVAETAQPLRAAASFTSDRSSIGIPVSCRCWYESKTLISDSAVEFGSPCSSRAGRSCSTNDFGQAPVWLTQFNAFQRCNPKGA